MRAEQQAGRASKSGAYRSAVRFSSWWLRSYTRNVDPRYIARRESEVSFELWEHADVVEDRGWSAFRATAGLLIRTMAAMPRDWSWRRIAVLDDGYPGVPVGRLLGRRHRPHVWIPLQQGHIFDQTNGMIEAEQALPFDRGRLGTRGNARRF